MAKLCRSVCGLTFLVSPAASAAASTTRLSWRVVMGRAGSWPGNSHPARPHDALLSSLLPPSPEQRQAGRARAGHVDLAPALAALDDDEHAPAVDVADLERRHLGDAQPGTVGDGERGAMLEAGRRRQQARDLVRAEHDREFAGIAQADQLAGEIRAIDRVVEEEAQSGHGAVHGGRVSCRARTAGFGSDGCPRQWPCWASVPGRRQSPRQFGCSRVRVLSVNPRTVMSATKRSRRVPAVAGER